MRKRTHVGVAAVSAEEFDRDDPMAARALGVGECTEYAAVELAEAEELFCFGRASYSYLQVLGLMRVRAWSRVE